MSMRKKLIVANWKAYVTSRRQAEALARSVVRGYAALPPKSPLALVLCPPFPYLFQVSSTGMDGAQLGAQDVFWEGEGPYTGEVTLAMLKDAGVTHVIVGHSERRRYLGESDEMINRKVLAALGAKLHPILCVGEWEEPQGEEEERKAFRVVREQLETGLKGVTPQDLGRVVLTYEPVWAISGGGGSADTPENAGQVARYLRRVLAARYGADAVEKIPVLYGGSVTAANVEAFLRDRAINGALVGGASVRAEEFVRMLKNVADASRSQR